MQCKLNKNNQENQIQLNTIKLYRCQPEANSLSLIRFFRTKPTHK